MARANADMPPKGLTFDARFESGNLAQTRLVSENPLEYDVHIRPDTLNSRHRVWFYFGASSARPQQKVVLNLVGYSKTKSLFRDGMAPVVTSSAKPFWERMPQETRHQLIPRYFRQRTV